MKTLLTIGYVAIFTMIGALCSCNAYLDAKPDKKLATITNIKQLQALLDDYSWVNYVDPSPISEAADNYYIIEHDFEGLQDYLKGLYLWDVDLMYPEGYERDWSNCYGNVYRANIVLENIDAMEKTKTNRFEWNNVKGQAYFYRAKSFLLVASIWCLAYDKKSAKTDLGIPLRLSPDFSIPSVRANLEETYRQIISDLKKAIPLLPVNPVHMLRPSRPAALGLLSRTYLFMRQYDSCFRYADQCLGLKDDLLDYNLLPKDATYTFDGFLFEKNTEMIHASRATRTRLSGDAIVDSLLYNSYTANDLRKYCLFFEDGDGNPKYKGSYSGWAEIWDGIAVDEIYLMRAECYARQGKTKAAMQDLNTLLVKRWKAGTYVPMDAANADDALNLILNERRKELIMRNLRWMDIKRLNKEGRNIVPTRLMNGKVYKLPPDDPRYALPIPKSLVRQFDIEQNPY